MYRPKEIKLKIVEAVLAELPSRPLAFSTELTNEQIMFQWFMTGQQEGLRLSPTGNKAFVQAQIEFFDVDFSMAVKDGWYGTLMEMSKKITCPYYLGTRKETKGKHDPYIRLYDSKVAMMVGLYGNMKEYLESIRLKTRKY